MRGFSIGHMKLFMPHRHPPPFWQAAEALGALLPPHRDDVGYDILAAR